MTRRSLLTVLFGALGSARAQAVPAPADPTPPATPRQSYADSCKRLDEAGLLDVPGVVPVLPDRMPRHDDEEFGVSFFRTEVRDEDLSNLTLPRTFFGRSEIVGVSFHNTDLSESNLCWNDFEAVDFSTASLAGCDARSSAFVRTDFRGADLGGADLRRSAFEDCRFEGARMDGVLLTRGQIPPAALSKIQASVIRWSAEGPEPDGG